MPFEYTFLIQILEAPLNQLGQASEFSYKIYTLYIYMLLISIYIIAYSYMLYYCMLYVIIIH